jgi:hypothetical protein
LKFTSILIKGLLYTIATFAVIVIVAIILVYFNKDKIVNATLNEVNKHLKAKIEIDPEVDVSIVKNFPQISLTFKKVKLYEALPPKHLKFAQFDNIAVSFDAINLFNKKYIVDNLEIKDGFVNLRVGSFGNKNFDILKSDTTKSGSGNVNLDDINLNNLEITYLDERNDFLYSSLLKNATADLKILQETTSVKLVSELVVHQIKVNESLYFKEKEVSLQTSLLYQNTANLTKIEHSSLTVENGTIDLLGEIETKKSTRVDLKISEKGCNIQTLLSLFPENELKQIRQYESQGKIHFEAIVKGYIDDKVRPGLEVTFGFENASFYHPGYKLRISKVFMKGFYSNGIAKNAKTSVIKLSNIKALFDNRPIYGYLTINNFDDPNLHFECKGVFNLASLIKIFPIKEIDKLKGLANADIEFEGRIKNLEKLETSHKVKVSGEVDLSSTDFTTPTLRYPIKNLSGDLIFNNNDIAISDLKFMFGRSDITLDGIFKNFLSRVIFRKGGVMVEAEVTSNFISLDELSTAQKQSANPSSTATDLSQAIVFPPYLNLDLQCSIKKIKYHNFKAQKLLGKILINYPNLRFENVQTEVAEGSAFVNSESRVDQRGFISTIADIRVNELKMDSVFFMFDNFSQSFITNKNIKGEYSGKLNLKMMSGPRWNIIPSSIYANVDGSLKNGELKNFEPMQKLAKFIDEEKLNHIYFSELKNNFFIENEKIFIPEMEIRSSLSNISISGTHTFNQEIDYKVTVPLKNFKKEKVDKDEAFGAIEKNVQTGGSNVFVTIIGTTDNFKIAYDKKKTGKKMKQDLKKEKEELRTLFQKKKPEPIAEPAKEQEFFDFD